MNREEMEKYMENDFLPSLLPMLPNITDLEAENARLKAEVERLQKLVGMQKSIDDAIDAWIESKREAAKEGKPSV